MMNPYLFLPLTIFLSISFLFTKAQDIDQKSVTIPFILDHNRMLVDAEMQKKDGTWQKVKLWVDCGNPTLSLSEPLARDLGMDLSATDNVSEKPASIGVATPAIRIGGMKLDAQETKTKVMFQPFWLFSTMHNDANLPSTILKKYHVVFDYPNRQLTIAEPGSIQPIGIPSLATINPDNGIIQLDASIDNTKLSFALDNGASYCFISEDKLSFLKDKNPSWPTMTGTAGCANMWGWWPAGEQDFQVVRVPNFLWGKEVLQNVGLVGVPKFSPEGPTLGEWYSRKTVNPVDGFLGANALKNYRVEIDYSHSKVYFWKGSETGNKDMDIVGISVGQLADGSYQVVGIVKKDGKPVVEGISPGDILTSIGEMNVKGKTMGTVVNALRGIPGDIRILQLEREGKQLRVETKVTNML